MTANQWYMEITRVLDPTDPEGTRDNIAHIVSRIRLEESERCVAILNVRRKALVLGGLDHGNTAGELELARNEIIRTSPGRENKS